MKTFAARRARRLLVPLAVVPLMAGMLVGGGDSGAVAEARERTAAGSDGFALDLAGTWRFTTGDDMS